jgi:murein L,D-transpeptidase YafK
MLWRAKPLTPKFRLRMLLSLLLAASLFFGVAFYKRYAAPSPALQTALRERTPDVEAQLERIGVSLGTPVYIRIFKQEAELELWVQKGAAYQLFQTYPICKMSGTLGPKQREGDRQAPEGFYGVTQARLNPRSMFHLSMNIGYPNAYDSARGYTGSAIMIHGDCVSVGCYAMTDEKIEEIYLIVRAALKNKQSEVPVHVYPFRMTEAAMQSHLHSPWREFWGTLQPGYAMFEATKRPPRVRVERGHYVVESHAD